MLTNSRPKNVENPLTTPPFLPHLPTTTKITNSNTKKSHNHPTTFPPLTHNRQSQLNPVKTPLSHKNHNPNKNNNLLIKGGATCTF